MQHLEEYVNQMTKYSVWLTGSDWEGPDSGHWPIALTRVEWSWIAQFGKGLRWGERRIMESWSQELRRDTRGRCTKEHGNFMKSRYIALEVFGMFVGDVEVLDLLPCQDIYTGALEFEVVFKSVSVRRSRQEAMQSKKLWSFYFSCVKHAPAGDPESLQSPWELWKRWA